MGSKNKKSVTIKKRKKKLEKTHLNLAKKAQRNSFWLLIWALERFKLQCIIWYRPPLTHLYKCINSPYHMSYYNLISIQVLKGMPEVKTMLFCVETWTIIDIRLLAYWKVITERCYACIQGALYIHGGTYYENINMIPISVCHNLLNGNFFSSCSYLTKQWHIRNFIENFIVTWCCF